MLDRYLPRTEFESYEDFAANYKINVPEDFNFAFDIVDGWAKLSPDKPALVWCDDHGGERRFTFDELRRLSNKCANMLKSFGIKKGDTVMLVLRRRYEYWICALALNKLGAVVIPASLQLTAKDIVYRVSSADIRMLICVNDENVLSQVEAAYPQCKTLSCRMLVAGSREGWLSFDNEMEAHSEELSRAEYSNKSTDLMLIYFTSGTTGMPKMVMHNFAHPLGQIVTAKYWQRVQDGGLHMSVSDSGWAKFGWGKIYGQWICGAVIFAYDMDKFVPAKLLEKITQYKLTTFCAPPTMFRFILQEDLSKYDLSSIKQACNAGEPLNSEVFNRFYAETGIKLCEGFGQSESSVLIANFPWFEPKPGSMGKPAPLYNIDLVDADGNSCTEGDEGEIVARGDGGKMPCGLFTGYYRNEELTNTAFGRGFYGLGDMAWRDADGYYWFVGRNDDVIKCSGYRIGPFEVESALIEHEAVLECAVTAAPDPVRGQVVKATVVLKTKHKARAQEPGFIKELQEHVKNVTAPYKYPRIIEFVDELPKTLSGKIKRAEIRAADTDGK